MSEQQRLVNPFKPTAGMTPPVLIGRETVIDDFMDGLDEGPGAPGRLMRITGPRGSGKTVLLTQLGDIANDRGWTVVNVSGREPLCASIQEQLAHDTRIRSLDIRISLPVVSAEAHLGGPAEELSFREVLTRATRSLTSHGSGLLITVDEVQDASRDEMATIATSVQYMIRQQQNISLLFAGITTGVLDLLNGKGITFLRRAKAEELASIPTYEVARALRKTIETSGLLVDDDALSYAAGQTHGYAYLIQLVGYYVWREGRRHSRESVTITLADAKRGSEVAAREFGSSVLETAISGLTKPAVDYLLAMTEDENSSSTAEIARRMGMPASSANTYRRILIERQIIESTAPGFVAFSIPFMREYLLQHRADILARYGA
jgi:energy-coupling factor transporter ATP-binding protein EcfA2